MPVRILKREIATRGNGQVLDITRDIRDAVREAGIEDGLATVFVTGSTAGVTTLEFEPGLVEDLTNAFERLYPRELLYRHHERWGDDNGHSHVRASMLGPSLTVPVAAGELTLGSWQQIVLVDFDTRPRRREYVVQLTS